MNGETLNETPGTKTRFSTEIIAGITTFLTMAYIIFVNADILYANGATGMDKTALIAITCIVSGTVTILTGLVTKSYATAPALLMVGFFMMKNILNIDFKNLGIGFPSFIIILMIALSYSISTGLAFGFISYTLVKLFRGKIREIKPALWVINVLCILFFVV